MLDSLVDCEKKEEGESVCKTLRPFIDVHGSCTTIVGSRMSNKTGGEAYLLTNQLDHQHNYTCDACIQRVLARCSRAFLSVIYT